MTFCPHMIVSTIGSINFGFCLRLVLSTGDYVHIGLFQLGSCPLCNLATCFFVDFVSVYLGVWLHEILPT